MTRSALYKYVNTLMDHDLPAFLERARTTHETHLEYFRDHPRPDQCRVTHCSAKVVARGLCMKHYRRQQRTGTPLTEVAPDSLSRYPRVPGPKPLREIARELEDRTGVVISTTTLQRWLK